MAEEAAPKTVNSKPRNPFKRENPSENGDFLPNKHRTIESRGGPDLISRVERVQQYIVKRSLHVGQGLDLSNRRTGFLNRSTSHTRIQFAGNNIELTLTDSGREAEEWVRQQTPKKCIVGLDVEWRPSFAKGVENRTALLQLCTEKGCLILQMLYVDFVPEGLSSFLKEPGVKFVGVGVGKDVGKLRRDHGLECKGEVVELGPLAAKILEQDGLKQTGLKGLALAVLGLELSKPKKVCMSNWASRHLAQKQIEYACIDAFVSFAIGKKLFEPEP